MEVGCLAAATAGADEEGNSAAGGIEVTKG